MSRSSSCANTADESVAVSRHGPRSSASTLRPASHSSWPMMAPVHPKPTSTASTGLRVIAMGLSLRPAGTSFEADRGVRHALSVAGHPFLVIVVGARETNHLPPTPVFVAAVDRVGEVALLGVLPEHGEEGFLVDAIIGRNPAAFEPLQHL